MKFLCGHCKAKYHIPDEKIAGRTLRMDCRRCGKEILLKGDLGRLSKQPGPQSKALSSSTLGSEFRNQVHTVPPSMPPPDQWHVAINDVPVGPIRIAEIQRKMSTGSVGGDSLCWQEGFDDWRPIKEVPELFALLKQAPPPPTPSPVGRGIHRTGSRSRPRIVRSSAPAPVPAPPSNVVPMAPRRGGAQGAPAAMMELDELAADPTSISEPPMPEIASVPVVATAPEPVSEAPIPAAAPVPITFGDDSLAPPRKKRKLPLGAWIALAGTLMFSATLAVMFGIKLFFSPGTEVATVEPQVPAAATSTTPAEPTPAEPTPAEATPEAAPTAQPETPEETPSRAETTPEKQRQPRRDRPDRSGQNNAAAEKQLSDADRERLRRMAGGASSLPSQIAVDDPFSGNNRNQGEPLSASQLNAVVGRNRPRLRSCYERAIRGMGSPPEVRVNVGITVGRTGRVSQANVSANNNVSGLTGCVETAVRRWVFPASGAATSVEFPIVFGSG